MSSKPTHAEHFKHLAQALLRDAEPLQVWVDTDRGVCLQTAWRLPADESGMPCRSRPLRLIVSPEAMAVYARTRPQDQGAADRRFERWLRANMVGFTPTAGIRLNKSSPEEWVFSARDLQR